jgi:uncharacterized membrane protein YqhA
MRWMIEKARYLVLLGVIGLLFAGVAAFGWGLYRTGRLVYDIVAGDGQALVAVELMHIVDDFLIATTVLILAVGLYELFIAEVRAPECVVARNLHALKVKLSSMIVLVMAVKFVEALFQSGDPGDLLRTGIAIAVIAAGLIAFGYFGKED